MAEKNESAKGSKKDRIRGKESHKRYNLMNTANENRMKRELKNLRQNPNDLDCFKRLCRYLYTNEAGMSRKKIEAVVAVKREELLWAGNVAALA